MGEKGNVDAASMVTSGAASLIERTTTNVTETVIGTSENLAEAIRDKAIGAVADEAVAAAREKMQGDDAASADDGTPPST